MVIFKNKASGNHFAMDTTAGKVIHFPISSLSTLLKLSGALGGIDILELPDLKTVHSFRRLVEKGTFKDTPILEVHKTLLAEYPEYFI